MNVHGSTVLLQAIDLRKVYRTGDVDLEVLKNLDLEVYEKEFLAISGESGSGKSTLLHLLGCLDAITAGKILFRGQDLTRLGNGETNRIRNREFGFVFQFHHLMPEFSALENVALPGLIARRPAKEIWKQAEEMLRELRLGHRLHHKPARLSGGEQQRVAVARAMINRPSILFLDEPTGNLDHATSDELIALIREQQTARGLTIVMVTHNQAIAGQADRHLLLHDGCLHSLPGNPLEPVYQSAGDPQDFSSSADST
ncbi:MAG TPA: ABC transporter ATP-binding protein [bacterium]|nr:ABC transporter ATP-binding protein [Candidatus Omnitrophota bacterium]HOJ61661.1 ABC transporter ATP-binding protein [bacterium]HOL95559.1 ABC transporter ATP-binding protein [bacterium]HPP00701.1 ABC transporter ATP-binding protein [bacterium]HXK95606.1 ABC transporter ATP-binding protein [bacterium]